MRVFSSYVPSGSDCCEPRAGKLCTLWVSFCVFSSILRRNHNTENEIMPNEPSDSEQQKPSAIDRVLDAVLERNRLNRRLHWTTIISEKTLLAVIGLLTVVASADAIFSIFMAREVTLPDLFLLFIYVEIIGMIGAFYSTNRIPVTLPIIIAITALCRLIVMQSKEMDALTLLAEAGAIFILSGAAYLMSLKDKMSLEKLENRD
ncbi:MAG: phosphate-starvation-inducible PsiE family protein [Pseudomonadales bacterium]|nr:phosphate-starvation-inducible PsiE family protein [Pseudomonadales bacterium]